MSSFKQTKVAKVGRPRQNVRKHQGKTRRSGASFPYRGSHPYGLPPGDQGSDPRHISKQLMLGRGGPPAFSFQPKSVVRRRYEANASINGTFNIQSGNNQFMVATTAILLNCYVEAWRIKSVEMWSAYNPSTNTLGYCFMSAIAQDTGMNSFNSVPWQVEDQTNSNDKLAHVKRVFNRSTPEGNWHYGSTTNTGGALFNLLCNAQTYVDITYEIIHAVGAQGASFAQYTTAVAGANPGTLYARIPMTNLFPQEVNSI